MKALCMRNEDDLNTAHDMKSICRAALLNDNAPDSELYQTRVRVFGEQQFLLTTDVWNSEIPEYPDGVFFDKWCLSARYIGGICSNVLKS